MSRYSLEIADIDDDFGLRLVLAETPMPGMISIGFQREPSYFKAAAVDGRFRHVAAVRDQSTGRIVGLGCRSICTRYVNGQPAPIGYLSNIRLLPEHRRGGLVARLYAFLHDIHQDGRTSLYLTTIAEDNRTAFDILTTKRAGLPEYHFAGRYHTMIFPLAQRMPRCNSRSDAEESRLEIRPARDDDRSAIQEFLCIVGSRRQFFPCYEPDDLFREDGLLCGLRPNEVLLAFREGRMVGTLGAWNQQPFRQQVVYGYGWPLSWLRPLYNAGAWCRGMPRLPRPGTSLNCLMAAIPLTLDDDPAVFGLLLKAFLRKLSDQRFDYLFLGMHESDPLWPSLQALTKRRYTTCVFLACWEDGENLRRSLDGRPLYLELGSL